MFIIFMNIEKKYRHTFYSLEGGNDVTLSHFKSSKDGRKALVFMNNQRHWKSIEGKVEEWVQENWERWMGEEPEWLDENMKNMIPPRMIPNVADREKVELLRSERRRSSLFGRVSGRRKSSLLRAERVAPEDDQSDVVNF